MTEQVTTPSDETVYVCPKCGSDKIQMTCWVGVNTEEIIGTYSDEEVYCPRCATRGYPHFQDGHVDHMISLEAWKRRVREEGPDCSCEDDDLQSLAVGWVHSHDPLGIERCDTCKRFDDDDAAKRAHDEQCGCDWLSTCEETLLP